MEVQAQAVKVLPEIVNLEMRTAPRDVQELQQKLQTLDHAVDMVSGTKYVQSLAPKMREACESQMDELRRTIERRGRRH